MPGRLSLSGPSEQTSGKSSSSQIREFSILQIISIGRGSEESASDTKRCWMVTEGVGGRQLATDLVLPEDAGNRYVSSFCPFNELLFAFSFSLGRVMAQERG